MIQSGWEKTPHKKKRAQKRGVTIECRFEKNAVFPHWHKWTRWKWYKDLKTAKEALSALRKSHSHGLIPTWEFRIPDEYLEDET